MADALAAQMAALDAELAALGDGAAAYQGHSSADLAAAFAEYARLHPDGAMPAVDAKPAMMAAEGAVQYVAEQLAFDWAKQLSALRWAAVIYGIVWMVLGLLLLFFGYASLFWLARRGARSKTSAASAASALPGIHAKGARRAPLGGGIGGAAIGFLAFSTLAAIINAAVCVPKPERAMSPGAFFAVWLIPGLIGLALCGHFAWLARIFSGLLASACLTIILTATFGIHTLLIRSVLIAVSAALLTAPLLLHRNKMLVRVMLNGTTALIGIVTFLNGVALFAPPVDASHAWLNLLPLLFAPDSERVFAAWGAPAFKGLIAGAILGVVIGFAVQLLLSRHAGEDAEASWNEYLGAYTERYEKSGMLPGQYEGSLARAGLFEPNPSVWQRIGSFFEQSSGGPASYGHVAGGQTGAPLTALPARSRRSASARSRGPAKFSALGRDGALATTHEDDDDETDVDSDAEDDKKALFAHPSKAGLSDLAKSTYALPSPPPFDEATPSYHSAGGSGSGTGSGLSGKTKVSDRSVSVGDDGAPHKAFDSYTDGAAVPRKTASPPPAAAAAGNPSAVPATPSLINAISRIQAAQAQARAWHAAQQAQGADAAPYGVTPASPPPQSASAPGSPAFQEWWSKEVKGRR